MVDPLTTDASCYLRVADADALHAEWGVAEPRATRYREGLLPS